MEITGIPNVSGNSLSGHLRLRCENRADGTPFIADQSFRVPIHISKSHVDHGSLVVSIINPTAGFFDGDRVEIDVEASASSRLVLSTPSASRVYPTRSGKSAANFQKFTVGENASLEWIPEPFIPHTGASYFQKTDIELHETSSLLFFEWIAPGRVAKGEIFSYKNLRWELDIRHGGSLIARERYDLDPLTKSLEALRARFPAAHYLSIYTAGDFSRNFPAAELDALTTDDTYLGHGPIGENVHVIRALCRDSLSARKLLETLRTLLYQSADLKPPSLGRIFL